MAASFPSTIKVFRAFQDYVDFDLAANMNEIHDEIVALETNVGPNPGHLHDGLHQPNTVGALLDQLDTNKSDISHSHTHLPTLTYGGPTTGPNLSGVTNTLQALNGAGAPMIMALQPQGGDLSVGVTGASTQMTVYGSMSTQGGGVTTALLTAGMVNAGAVAATTVTASGAVQGSNVVSTGSMSATGGGFTSWSGVFAAQSSGLGIGPAIQLWSQSRVVHQMSLLGATGNVNWFVPPGIPPVSCALPMAISGYNGQVGLVPSASEYKKNIRALKETDLSGHENPIFDLQPVHFEWNLEKFPERLNHEGEAVRPDTCTSEIGFLVEHVQAIDRNLVVEGFDGVPMQYKTNSIVGLLTDAVQHLRSELNSLKAAHTALRDEHQALVEEVRGAAS